MKYMAKRVGSGSPAPDASRAPWLLTTLYVGKFHLKNKTNQATNVGTRRDSPFLFRWKACSLGGVA